MPTRQVESVFLTGSLIWDRALNGRPGGIGTTQANIDTVRTSTEQVLSQVFTVGTPPPGSPDGVWDQLTFTVNLVHENPTISATEEDHGIAVFRLFNSNGSPTSVPSVSVVVAPENAPAGTTTMQVTVTFHNVAPGNYRLFAGEMDSGDGQALRIQVSDGHAVETVCFADGTMIMTSKGCVPVQELEVGDLVQTRDHGLQAVRWIGSRRLSRQILGRHERLRPVRIAAGALGQGVPVRDLMVSPQHRVMLRSRIAMRMFGETEVLCPAKHLLPLPGVEIAEDLDEVTYTHLLFDRHEIVFSNGAETESLFTGPQALRSVTPEQREEILTIFPNLAEISETYRCCRTVINGRQGRKLVQRHQKTCRPIVERALTVGS